MNNDILLVGDIHFDVKNFEDCVLFKDKLIDWVENNSPGRVVFMGDLTTHFVHHHTNVINLVYDMIMEIVLHSEVDIVIGNHDVTSSSMYLDNNHIYKIFGHMMGQREHGHRVIVYDKPYLENDILFVPYVPPGRFFEAIKDVYLSKVKTILCHQEFAGANMNGRISDHGDVWNKNIKVYSGHIHDAQVVGNVTYVGTPFAHTFGETSEKSLLLLRGKERTEKRIFIDMPKKITFRVGLKEVDQLIFDEKHHYKVEISASNSELGVFKKSAKYQELVSKKVKISLESTDELIISTSEKRSYTEELMKLIVESQNVDIEFLKTLLTEAFND